MAEVEPIFFEGTEKLLEVWFSSSTGTGANDLRSISREKWDAILTLVKCDIISMEHNGDMDAYVLSESSMFVTERRFILKTCGTTTLLRAVEPLLNLARDDCGLDTVDDIFYSRKNFMKPEKQDTIHRYFDDEVRHLDQLFKNGAAYTLGRVNRDCWYLYTLDAVGVQQPDQTVELLMWDMCPKKMQIFTGDVSRDGRDATKRSGICDILPCAKVDDFLFTPCGYSMNAIMSNGHYITIHVTPEVHCSYVSFESNVPQESYNELVNQVLKIFQPGKFLVTIFANKESIAKDSHKGLEEFVNESEYKRAEHQFCMFKNYYLTYTYFTRPII